MISHLPPNLSSSNLHGQYDAVPLQGTEFDFLSSGLGATASLYMPNAAWSLVFQVHDRRLHGCLWDFSSPVLLLVESYVDLQGVDGKDYRCRGRYSRETYVDCSCFEIASIASRTQSSWLRCWLWRQPWSLGIVSIFFNRVLSGHTWTGRHCLFAIIGGTEVRDGFTSRTMCTLRIISRAASFQGHFYFVEIRDDTS